MTFLTPWALFAAPLALLPLWLAWRARRAASPALFSSLYLVEKAQHDERRRASSRSRWLQIVRAIIVLLVVVAAARPVGPGRGGPGQHDPTRAIVAVDVSGSVSQRLDDGGVAWERIRSAADTLLALASDDDSIVLAAFADEIVGWWEGPAPALRRQLAKLEPSARPSDWGAVVEALAHRTDNSTESYLFTDGAVGGGEPGQTRTPLEGYRVIRVVGSASGVNRGLVGTERRSDGRVGLIARVWTADGVAAPVVAGRWIGGRVSDPGALPADGAPSPTSWAAPDTATFALVGVDPLVLDDRWYEASPAGEPAYRVGRWVPADDPGESGGLFWETALSAAAGEIEIVESSTLDGVLASDPALALLPLRRYRTAEVGLLEAAAARGTRLLFTPSCAAEACVPTGEWLPGTSLVTPSLTWSLAPATRRATLRARGGPEGDGPPAVPGHLLARAPIRPAIVTDGAAAEWTWILDTGEPVLWVNGSVAVWLAPLGPPVTHLGTTPIFPRIASAVLDAWDPRWDEARAPRLTGTLWSGGASGATITGPLGATGEERKEVPPGAPPLRLEEPGLYHVEREGSSFLAVNAHPGEGDLRPLDTAAWERMWGVAPAPPSAWRDRIFPARRGPELRFWFLALALVGLAVEATLRSAPRRPRP